jgi:hypothetical protein
MPWAHKLEAGKDLSDGMSLGSVLPDHAPVGRPVAAGLRRAPPDLRTGLNSCDLFLKS